MCAKRGGDILCALLRASQRVKDRERIERDEEGEREWERGREHLWGGR